MLSVVDKTIQPGLMSDDQNKEEKTPSAPQGVLACCAGCWRAVTEASEALKPCRVTLLLTLAVPVIFIWVDQASEVLRSLTEGQADGNRLQQFQFPSFVASL